MYIGPTRMHPTPAYSTPVPRHQFPRHRLTRLPAVWSAEAATGSRAGGTPDSQLPTPSRGEAHHARKP
ncbi:MAG: hypothetical protein QGI83_17705, partial [Candidatus Latescibacteria bacterium]|nr:hypothetical protein [Candidatus Latescibacterota bacterium]